MRLNGFRDVDIYDLEFHGFQDGALKRTSYAGRLIFNARATLHAESSTRPNYDHQLTLKASLHTNK